VLEGSAGTLLGLLALHAVTGDDCVLRRARDCGAHLLVRCAAGPMGPGFARGASGLAHALVRLHRATGDPAYLRAAAEAFAAEPAPADATWHRGAAGMALARLAARDLLGGEAWDRGIASLLDEVERGTVRSPDHLFAGGFGGVDALLEGGIRLGRPELVRAAEARAAGAIIRARGRGFYAVGAEDRYVPGMLAGLAGIGYTLLRLHRPDQIPGILI
jgi:lantibiotic modifying enzyme